MPSVFFRVRSENNLKREDGQVLRAAMGVLTHSRKGGTDTEVYRGRIAPDKKKQLNI